MCDIETENLIDFNLSIDDIKSKAAEDIQSKIESNPPNDLVPNPFKNCLISSSANGSESFDNNPFDHVQKLSHCVDDPFEIVEKEACFKALQKNTDTAKLEVRLANLISLSDDKLTDNEIAICDIDSTKVSTSSSIFHTATSNDLETESPPISMSIKWTPVSEDSAPEGSEGSASSTNANGDNSAISKRAIEHRKRLLKLSITNSTFNSPVSRFMPQKQFGSEESTQKASPLTTAFFEAAHYNDHMLASESPLKLVDDDLISEEHPNFIDSEKEFETDLEMLNIPMLKQLPSPVIVERSGLSEINPESATVPQAMNGFSDLESIRAKLQAKQVESAGNNQNIPQLIENLKSIICDSEICDDNRKRLAQSLLENLSSAFSTEKSQSSGYDSEEEKTLDAQTTLPQPIVRQGTFDIDLKENDEKEIVTNNRNCTDAVADTQNSTSGHSNPVPIAQLPDDMFKSSATYDGEQVADDEGIIRPKVETLLPASSQSSPTAAPQTSSQTNMKDVIEHISKLLEQHHLIQHNENSNGNTGAVAANPTFIVVMNTPQILPTETSSITSVNNLDNSFNEATHGLCNSSTILRPRSQSLSIHDKFKIIQIQTPLPSEDRDTPQITTPVSKKNSPEFQTPYLSRSRCNSYSSGTPHTIVKSSNYGANSSKRIISNTEAMTQKRRSSISYLQKERCNNIEPHPLAKVQTKMKSFNPDLRKKLRSGSSTESIMKSSGPLKATMPMTKVAPMMKRCSPTPAVTASTSNNTTLNNSMHLLRKSGKLAYTSTPMPLSRTSGGLGVLREYPNACSTPTTYNTPLRRNSISITKPRHSYSAATPSAKGVATSPVGSGIGRRSLTEFKAKSPGKLRISNAADSKLSSCMADVASTTKPLARGTKLTTANILRRQNATTSPTISGHMTSRLSLRPSVSGTIGNNKNKENKKT